MVHGHQQRQGCTLAKELVDLALQPGQLQRPQPTRCAARAMAVQQQQPAFAAGKERRRHDSSTPQGGPQQLGVIVVAGEQGHRRGPALQQLAEPDVASPGLVLAEIATDQQQLGQGLRGLGLVQDLAQPRPGLALAVTARWIRQQVGIAELQQSHRPKLLVPLLMRTMAAIPPGSRQRCTLCQVEIQGMVGGGDLVHFSQGGPGTRAKLWARVCQYLRSDEQRAQCLNQDANLRGSIAPSDYYAEPPQVDLGSALGMPGSEAATDS